jgi:hypothetical protein
MTERKAMPTDDRGLMLCARLERFAAILAAGPLGYLAGGRGLAVYLANRRHRDSTASALTSANDPTPERRRRKERAGLGRST